MPSQTVKYALSATLYIARRDSESARVPEIAAAIDAPPDYLAKILGQLARAGLLESTRGPGGGFCLAVPPDRVPLSAIIAVFGLTEQRRCLLGSEPCGASPSCVAHSRWSPIAGAIDDFFAVTTLADLITSPAPRPAVSPRVCPVASAPSHN